MNNTIYEKDFVPYETAKLLKEAGFCESCEHFYKSEGHEDDTCWVVPGDYNSLLASGLAGFEIYSAPTLWQAQKWLREVKGIDIIISVYREIDETVSPRIIKRSYECEITAEDDEDYIPYSEDDRYFPSYESALSAGIDAALELITNKTE